MDYETVIGLEIHVELSTESKMFCGCSVTFGEPPNTHTCPICLGHPGVLPVINKTAVEYAIKIALALDCQIALVNQFHRKNYFYPDMPKDYQISQYDLPLGVKGYLDAESDGKVHRIGITRVHMEEDTGKLVHVSETGRIRGAEYSLVDFNRAGTPLIEIVTEPDITSPEEAKTFLQKLRSIILALGVSDCNMEEGSLRCDANISIRPKGVKEKGVKTEVKNMNSFRALQKALTYEVERQKRILEEGGEVVQETRHWDDATSVTTVLRTKEEESDYRYFPDPDLVPLQLDQAYIEELKASLPELPDARRERFIRDYELPVHEATLLSSTKEMGDFFEECLEDYRDAKKISNWILGELSAHLNQAGLEIDQSATTPKHLVDLLTLIDKGVISGKMAKDVFKESFETGKLPRVIVEEKSLVQITDEAALAKIVDQVVEENPKAVEDFKKGQERAVGFLVGQVMRLTQGKANPEVVNKLLKQKLTGE